MMALASSWSPLVWLRRALEVHMCRRPVPGKQQRNTAHAVPCNGFVLLNLHETHPWAGRRARVVDHRPNDHGHMYVLTFDEDPPGVFVRPGRFVTAA
jgi:hypothetical protein